MISTTADSFLQVDGWEEHQNIDGMERIRESKRMAQAKWRAKKKGKSAVDSTVDSTEISRSISVDYADKEEDIEEIPLRDFPHKTIDVCNTRGAASKGGTPPVQLFDPYKPETWGDAE